MVSLGALWLPILLSAVLVFVASTLIHMVLKYHASDYRALPNEDAFRAAFRGTHVPPGPVHHSAHLRHEADGQPRAHREAARKGPVAVLNLRPNGVIGMGKSLGQWFVFSLVVSAVRRTSRVDSAAGRDRHT